jgi:hypothetical protein
MYTKYIDHIRPSPHSLFTFPSPTGTYPRIGLILPAFFGGGVGWWVGFVKLRALCLQSRHSALEPHLQSILLWLFWRSSHKLFAWACLKPHFSQSYSVSHIAGIIGVSHCA